MHSLVVFQAPISRGIQDTKRSLLGVEKEETKKDADDDEGRKLGREISETCK